MTLSFLYLLSFILTKSLGIDRTLRFFQYIGMSLAKLPHPHKSLDGIEESLTVSLKRVPVAAKCLDQAVIAWTVLNYYHYPAIFRIGLSLSPVESHAWVVVNDRVFVDTYNLTDLKVVAEYPHWTSAKK